MWSSNRLRHTIFYGHWSIKGLTSESHLWLPWSAWFGYLFVAYVSHRHFTWNQNSISMPYTSGFILPTVLLLHFIFNVMAKSNLRKMYSLLIYLWTSAICLMMKRPSHQLCPGPQTPQPLSFHLSAACSFDSPPFISTPSWFNNFDCCKIIFAFFSKGMSSSANWKLLPFHCTQLWSIIIIHPRLCVGTEVGAYTTDPRGHTIEEKRIDITSAL